jgi:ATP diphosphatase
MIRRHPHVFGTAEERAAGAAPGFWERIKAEEKAEASASARVSAARSAPPAAGGDSVLDGVPVALPALTRAIKLQNKAARVGFDWPSLAPVLDKLKEELGELEDAVSGPGQQQDRAKVEEEFGDLLFVVANVARHLGIDPEAALRGANQKFIRRFHAIECKLAEQGRTPAQSTLAEMDLLWDEAKAGEKSR